MPTRNEESLCQPPDQPWRIGTASGASAAALARLVRLSITRGCVQDHGGHPVLLRTWLRNKTGTQFAAWIADPLLHCVAAVEVNAMMGFAMASRSQVLLCYVHPAKFSQGMGRALMQAIETRALTSGLSHLSLQSTRTARGFYLRQGFLPAGAAPDKSGLEGQSMRKQLR